MKLYYDPASTACRPIMLFAAEQGLKLDYVHVDLMSGAHREPAFLAITPVGAVPALDDDGFVLTEAPAILRYLAEKTGSAAWPSDAKARARVDEAMSFLASNVSHAFCYGVVYAQVLPHFTPRGDAAVRAETLADSTEKADRWLKVLDLRLKERAWLAGDEISLADYYGAGLISLADLVGFSLAPYPHLARWLDAMKARPAWREVNAVFDGWCAMRRQAELQTA